MPTPFDGTERSIELTHGKTRYFEKGSGAPCLLLHGAGYSGGAATWFRNIDALSGSFRVLAPDLLGWGVGDRPERHLAFPYLVEFVREFQDALGLEHSHVVGHSLGGWIAQLFAYESPQRVDRLALVAAAGHESHHVPPALAQFSAAPSRDEIQTRIAALPGITDEEVEGWTELEYQNASQPGGVEAFKQMLEFMTFVEERDRYITPRRWEHIRSETLVVSGTTDQGYPPEVGARIAAAIPTARQVVLDAGHMIPLEAPKELNDVLLQFLNG